MAGFSLAREKCLTGAPSGDILTPQVNVNVLVKSITQTVNVRTVRLHCSSDSHMYIH
jgi:hypothetical protein